VRLEVHPAGVEEDAFADERGFFYGINFELSYNAKHWDPARWGGEIRPIVGWRRGTVDFIINPILDTGFDGLSRLDFAPAARVAYNFSAQWAVAIEHYADFGKLRKLLPAGQQTHSLFAVADYTGKRLYAEAGLGFGLTRAADDRILKLLLTWPL